jgi:hypothetical protein
VLSLHRVVLGTRVKFFLQMLLKVTKGTDRNDRPPAPEMTEGQETGERRGGGGVTPPRCHANADFKEVFQVASHRGEECPAGA